MLATGSSAPGFNTYTPTHVNILSLSYTTVPRNDLIIEIRGGYNRFLQDFLPQDRAFNPQTIGLDTLPDSTLEPKADLKDRIGFSPDEFDAHILTFAQPVTIPDYRPRDGMAVEYNPYVEEGANRPPNFNYEYNPFDER